MARLYFERHSLALALTSYLQAKGWTDITKIYEGFQTGQEITAPSVGVYFSTSTNNIKEVGQTEKSFARSVQIDCYMESEARAMAIVDTIADFFDEETITIRKPDGSILGILYTEFFEAISMNVIPPVYANPAILRWRGIVKVPMLADYINEVDT